MSWTCRLAPSPSLFLRRHRALDEAWSSSLRMRASSSSSSRPSITVGVTTTASTTAEVRATARAASNGRRAGSIVTHRDCGRGESSSSRPNKFRDCSATTSANGTRQNSLKSVPRFTFREKDLPSILKQVLRNKNTSGPGPMLMTARFYSPSSHRRSNTNEKNNASDAGNNKTNPAIIAGDDDAAHQKNIESATSSQQIPRGKNGTSAERPNEEPQRPSEPSVHDISYLPPSLRPYAQLARLDKPIGTFLLLHPCLWSTALAAPLGSPPDLHLCALFALGSFVMRGAGCTINDMWDSRFDREVERTKSRPLAAGDLTYPQAWGFLALQLSAGLGVLLSLPHQAECFAWGAAALPLVATYPLAKRWTNYPQLALGLTFNWGAVMGWVAARGEVDWAVVGPLYAGCVAWTLVYDTLYAHQDKADDARLGLKSTALTFGEHTKPVLTALAGAAWLGWTAAGYNCGLGGPMEAPYYYAGASAAAAHLLWQIRSADLDDAENLGERFRSNNLVGWIVFGSCVAGNMMAG